MADSRSRETKAPNWGGSARPGRGRNRSMPKRSVAKRIVLVLVAAVVFGLVSLSAVVVVGYQTTKLPDPNAEFTTATTTVFYNNGKSQLGTFAVQNRQPISYDQMPKTIKDAVVSAENRTFWTDQGVSVRGLFRAAWVILRGGDLQGGSTITQQYIKILYLNSGQTLTRKFRELFLAYKISKERTKEQILEGYLNTIYFGRGAYGIQAASKAYFDVDAADLNVPQAAFLATVLNNPSLYDPADDDNLPRIRERYSYVLQSMFETGSITAAQAAGAARNLPEFPKIKTSDRYGGPKGFLLKMVERELITAGFDASTISGGGLQVTTTFDKQDQNAAVKAAQKYTKEAGANPEKRNSKAKSSDLHAAVASVEVGTGEVLAIYGGPDFIKNSRNWATTARPTASTFKTFAAAAALDDDFSLYSRLNGNTFTPPGDADVVRNEFSRQYGSGVTLLRATTDSINTAFVDLALKMDDGPTKIAEVAEAAGAPKGAGWDLNARIPLGTAEVSPLDQAGAYATFANGGTHVANHVVKEVKDASGTVLYKAAPKQNRAVSENVARDVTYALSNVVEQGTGTTVQTLNRPVAGKTGTKDGTKDDVISSWFVAYTPQISTAVMYVAGDDGTDNLDDYARLGNQTFFGSSYPALTWADYMETALQDLPVKKFEDPAYVNKDQAGPPETSRPESTRSEKPTDRATEQPTETQSAAPTTEAPTTTAPAQPSQTSPPATTRPPSSSGRPSAPQQGQATPRGGG